MEGRNMIRILFSVPLCLLLSVIGCERRTQVRLEGGNPPRFVLSGSGKLGQVIIFGPEQEEMAKTDPFDKTYALWEIATEKDGEKGATSVEELSSITYGVLPHGYVQIKPKNGTPAALMQGKRYRYWFVTVNAPHASGYFEIRDSKAVPVSGP
jgi:hypothetical protein